MAGLDDYVVDIYPTVYLLPEDLERIKEIETSLSDYVTQMTAKFITGEESLDNCEGSAWKSTRRSMPMQIDAAADHGVNVLSTTGIYVLQTTTE